jgi:hypothetical protein
MEATTARAAVNLPFAQNRKIPRENAVLIELKCPACVEVSIGFNVDRAGGCAMSASVPWLCSANLPPDEG